MFTAIITSSLTYFSDIFHSLTTLSDPFYNFQVGHGMVSTCGGALAFVTEKGFYLFHYTLHSNYYCCC